MGHCFNRPHVDTNFGLKSCESRNTERCKRMNCDKGGLEFSCLLNIHQHILSNQHTF